MFARAKTPPGYWDIGFPSTPKVDALNKEAYEMHMKYDMFCLLLVCQS